MSRSAYCWGRSLPDPGSIQDMAEAAVARFVVLHDTPSSLSAVSSHQEPDEQVADDATGKREPQ